MRKLTLALALTWATTANADLYRYDFSGWLRSDQFVRGNGIIESDGIGGNVPVFLRAGGITLQYFERIGGSTPYCNADPSSCRPVYGITTGQPMTITSVQWWWGTDLMFFTTGYPVATNDDFRRLTLTAVPGPLAGSGLLALAVLLGLLRRRA